MNFLSDLDFKKAVFLIPYAVVAYIGNRLSWLYRMSPGDLPGQKLLFTVSNMGHAGWGVWPSFNLRDILVGIEAAVFFALLVAIKRQDRKKYRPGIEYGSARWGTLNDIKPLMDKKEDRNIILTATESLSMKTRPPKGVHFPNKNVLVIGGSGSGKTRFFVKPNLMQLHSSYVVTDPKGTLVLECGKMFENAGYKIKILNTVNFKKSMHYNPFSYIKSEKDISSFVSSLVKNTKSEGASTGEDFWVKAEILYLTALVGYIWYEAPEEEQNFDLLLDLINASETREDDENFKNAVDLLFEDLERRDKDNFAVRQYKKYKLAAGKTAKSILISCGARLSPFDIKEESDEIDAYLSLIQDPKKTTATINGKEIKIPKDERPAYLEWISWRAFLAIDHMVNSAAQARHFNIDSSFLPTGTASGGDCDVLVECKDTIFVVEVTLTTGSRQESAETESVRRHVSDIMRSRPDKRVVGVFIANTVASETYNTYSASWDFDVNGRRLQGRNEAVVGLGTFLIREYIPATAVDNINDLVPCDGWDGPVLEGSSYVYSRTIVIDDTNGEDLQTVTLRNRTNIIIGTTLTDFANRHITVVGENIEFTDVVAYQGCYVGATYTMHATLVDTNGRPIRDANGNTYGGTTVFTTTSGSGTVPVTFIVNTADLVEATQNADGTLTYSPRSVVCFEDMTLENGLILVQEADANNSDQTVTVPNPEIGTEFADLQTEEHETVSGRIVEVVDHCSFSGLHIGETYTLTCRLYDQTTGNALQYSNGDLVIGTKTFVPTTESGTVDVTFTIDTSDLLVNVFQYEERTLVAFEYLRTANGILIGGHTDIDDLPQHVTPRLPSPRTSFTDDQTGSRVGRLGAAVPFTDRVSYTNLNIGETYQMRSSVVNRDDPSIVYATATVDFVPTSRDGFVDVHFTIDTSAICAGSNEAYIVCFEQLWQLDTQNTGRGDVLLARHEDVRDQDQTIYLPPEVHTQMTDVVTNSNYGMIGENVEFVDVVSYYRLHIGETYEVTGTLMDKQTGLPVLDENGQPITASTTFQPQTTDGTVEVTYHLNTLRLIQQVGQTINGVTIEAPREIVSFESIRSSSGFDFEIHADINDEGQTIILGDISSGAGDVQTSTSWLAAGMTTVRDTVHYRGLGPVEYTVRGSLHLVDYDANGNPIDGGLIPARAGEVTETSYTWTPSTHEGNVNLDYRIDSTRFAGRNIIVFEELWYNGICIISHEHYCDANGGYGMNNLEQTVRVASLHTNAYSFQTGAQMVARDTQATINDFCYYGNVEIGQNYFVEGTLWGCYTDENGYIHSSPISKEDGGQVTSAVFTATQASGVVEVQFTINSLTLEQRGYDYVVVTERLIHVGSNVCIANHSDISDQAQTIMIPDVRTTASTDTGRTLAEGNMPDIHRVTVRDRVYYENLVCDGSSSYTVVGNLQYAKTDANGNITESGPLIQNGQPVTNSVTFVPTSPTGYIDIEFTVDVSDIMAHEYNKIVVFEDLYYGPEGVIVASHADITDEDQTIDVPGTPTPTPTPPETPPKTGDDSGYANFVAGAIVAFTLVSAGLSLLMILNRKKDNKKKK